MRIDRLEESEHDPQIHCQDVQISGDCAPEDWAADGPEAEAHDFDGGGVFSCKAKRRRILVMNFMDVFIEWSPMHGAMGPIVPSVFKDEKDCELVSHGTERWERDAGAEAEELSHGVEEPKFL